MSFIMFIVSRIFDNDPKEVFMARLLVILVSLVAFSASAQDFTMLGGEMTSYVQGPPALQVFAPNVFSAEHRAEQINGFSFFHTIYDAQNGVGPRFINKSCGGCHVQNGRGALSFNNTPLLSGGSLVVKVKYLDNQTGPEIPPVLQNNSLTGEEYHSLSLRWRAKTGRYPDGMTYTLREPALKFTLNEKSFRKYAYSLRMSPPVVGPGLIEAIDDATILSRSDPKDRNRDGISGRPNMVTHIRTGATAIGRFGFKAGQPTVEQQSAAALGNEMGLSNTLFTVAKDGLIEFPDEALTSVTVYQKLGGVPAARDQFNPSVQSGKGIFFTIGCEACHTATVVTGANAYPELSNQTIHPFSDFLLHDMGKGLSTNYAEGSATGSEWKTTPLWGLGFSKYLSNLRPHYLHDGRARTLEEAILWHDGEAKKSKDKFMELDLIDRLELITFLRAL